MRRNEDKMRKGMHKNIERENKGRLGKVLYTAGILSASAMLCLGVSSITWGAETLVPDRVAASSSQSDAYGNYVADYIKDGNLSTAWVEGASGDGIGEFVDFFYPAGTYITGGTIYPAYYKSQDVFEKNGGVTKFQLQSGSEIREVDCSSAAQSMVSGGYTFQLDEGITCDGTLRVTIKEVRGGWKYSDTCISELSFVGTYGNGSSGGNGSGGNGSGGSGSDGGNGSGGSNGGNGNSQGTAGGTDIQEALPSFDALAGWAYKKEVSDDSFVETTIEAKNFSADTKSMLLYWYQYHSEYNDPRIQSYQQLYNSASVTDMKNIGVNLVEGFSDADFDTFVQQSYVEEYDPGRDWIVMNGTGDFGAVGNLYFTSGAARFSNKGNMRVDGIVKVWKMGASGYEDAGYYTAYYTPSGDSNTMYGWKLTSVQVSATQPQ